MLFSTLIVVSWSSVTLLLKLTHPITDPLTFTWVRFTFSGTFMALTTWRTSSWLQVCRMQGADLILLIAASFALARNYAFASRGTAYLAPEACTLLLQLDPLFLAVGVHVFFRETVTRAQSLCFALIFVGLVTFVRQPLSQTFPSESTSSFGIFIMITSAIS
ncbi:EamA family transporter [Burkholderia sp. SCN-KJ]|uniref:EamA family transporter n=1 Tax=Burkholderia sp. SCN-KJ TaxID=2969248 RepID=UPI00214FBC22|nr:EamA family transporter [Burkholderia sp. SCN-KJ]MCR4470441.1 EamA family transporter [Burkholderia sp. SCN-KJ]